MLVDDFATGENIIETKDKDNVEEYIEGDVDGGYQDGEYQDGKYQDEKY